MALTMRPTGLGSGIDKDRADYSVFCGEWNIGRIYEVRGGPDHASKLGLEGIVSKRPRHRAVEGERPEPPQMWERSGCRPDFGTRRGQTR